MQESLSVTTDRLSSVFYMCFKNNSTMEKICPPKYDCNNFDAYDHSYLDSFSRIRYQEQMERSIQKYDCTLHFSDFVIATMPIIRDGSIKECILIKM